MKKIIMIMTVLVITSIAIIFSKNIKPYIQGYGRDLNQSVYSFLEDVVNRKNVYTTAIELNNHSSTNACVYFIAEVLRQNDFNVPKGVGNIAEIIGILEEKGWQKQRDYENLRPGDICFTTDGKGDKNGIPTHTYVFMKWVKEGNYDYAYICDNQAKDYRDNVYHIRNISVVTTSNGFSKEAFSFFMS